MISIRKIPSKVLQISFIKTKTLHVNRRTVIIHLYDGFNSTIYITEHVFFTGDGKESHVDKSKNNFC